MNIFLKYLFKSTMSKKGRSLLLIVTITISAALLIGALGAVTASSNASKEQSRRASGDYNVVIASKNTSETPFLYKDNIDKSSFDKYVASISIGGYLSKDNNTSIALLGASEEDYKKLPNMKILMEEGVNPLTGDSVIISEKISKVLNLNVGSLIKINVKGEDKDFKIGAIAETNGVFSLDLKNQFTVVTREQNVCKAWGVNGICNTVLAKLKSNINPDKFIKAYNDKNGESTAALAYDEKKMNSGAEQVSLLLYFMLLLVVFMSSFIIYSCFKLIVIERMPVLGTFLSQGETMGGIIKLLLSESLIYGLVSGILSTFLGAGLLYLLADITNGYKQYGVATKVEYNVSYFIVGIIFAIFISLVSAIIPVLAARKFQVKDIILNKVTAAYKESHKLSAFGAVLAIVSIFVNFGSGNTIVRISPILFITFLIGAILALPGIAKVLSYCLMKLFSNINILYRLAFNNIRTSKVLLNNIRLVAIGMVSIMIILSLSSSFTDALLGMTKDYKYDISVIQGTDPARVNSIIHKSPMVKEIIETYFTGDGQVKGSDSPIAIGGIDTKTFKEFNKYFVINDEEVFYRDLNVKDRNAAISSGEAKALHKSKGDIIILKANNKEVQYKITGIFETKLAPDQILINKDNMIKDFGVTVPDSYNLIVNGNRDNAKKALDRELKGTSAKVTTFDEDFKKAKDDFGDLIDILLFFSLMTAVVGIFGIVNNISVSFIQRKKDLAVLNSIGMTNGKNGAMIFIESIFTAIFAIVLGGSISYFAVLISNNLAKCIELSVPIRYDFSSFLIVSIGILFIMLLSSISVLFRNSKLSVIKELKYE